MLRTKGPRGQVGGSADIAGALNESLRCCALYPRTL